ncbi:GDSL esterase/lipase At5g03610-like [Nymphaea colorata]|nr:GDSL esterase/lipase At5g03610-like [Nymphaea colorata]
MGAGPVLGLLLVLLLGTKLEGHSHGHGHHQRDDGPSRMLFVFGDSYVDTGNIGKSVANSWKDPYGITFPGKPTGRFSDGRVLTDFVASYLGIKSPIPYRVRQFAGNRKRFGMNFAFGGTGVFDTLVSLPNMTTQIDLFQQLIDEGEYQEWELGSSMALVSVAGNDYSAYLARNGTMQGLKGFVESVVNRTAANIQRIVQMGVRKVAVVALQPVGCLPTNTLRTSYTACDDASNRYVGFHNAALRAAVDAINARLGRPSQVAILDLYGAFLSALQGSKFKDPLKPCCRGVSSASNCGSMDQQGNRLYQVCSSPWYTFFWDSVHPTQAGWSVVLPSLRPTLHQLLASL